MTEWLRNPGRQPGGTEGKRVKVRLFNGTIAGTKPISPTSPAGWPADGKGACNWRISNPPHPFEIKEYCVL